MARSVSICNTALTLLNTSRITSLSDNTETARKCNALYDDMRNSLLSEHNWNFARKEAELSLLDEDTILSTEWASIYQLPSDCLRVLRMESDERFSIKGKKLYTNSSSAKIEYIYKVEDEGQFTSAFVWAFATRLARDLSYGVTESTTVVQQMAALHEQALKEAKWSDAQEGISTDGIYGSLTDSRG